MPASPWELVPAQAAAEREALEQLALELVLQAQALVEQPVAQQVLALELARGQAQGLLAAA